MSKSIHNSGSVTRNVTLALFLLMFGYKLFSLYFPLYIASRGLSLAQVGFSYLLIYLPIALGAPLAGLLCRKTNPALLMVIGILGYAAYALAMIFAGQSAAFLFVASDFGIFSGAVLHRRAVFIDGISAKKYRAGIFLVLQRA